MRQSLTLIEPAHGIATATSEPRTLGTGAREARHDAFLNARTLELRDRAKDAGHEPAGRRARVDSLAHRDECSVAAAVEAAIRLLEDPVNGAGFGEIVEAAETGRRNPNKYWGKVVEAAGVEP